MDQLVAMRTFVKVVQMGNFSQAAKDEQGSQANMSKRVAALEHKLGVKLLTRSSRGLALTEVGTSYYQKCLSILAQLDEADAHVQHDTISPRGKLKVAVPLTFSRIVLAPIIKQFIERYPEIHIELVVSDVYADIIAQGIDVAIRGQVLEDSSLIAIPLYKNPVSLVASQDYLAKFGTPNQAEELVHHNIILHSSMAGKSKWRFTRGGKETLVQVKGNIQSNNAETNLEAALSGLGITGLAAWRLGLFNQSWLRDSLFPCCPIMTLCIFLLTQSIQKVNFCR
ncbi:MAG: LysR family transcriptional regulator [Bermanella sp.]